MEHKAFRFDYQAFAQELKPILEDALRDGDPAQVRAFVLAHLDELTDPDEGRELRSDWESLVEPKDVHQYADYALTKYYNPNEDVGLGDDWTPVHEATSPALGYSPVLGSLVGVRGEELDPGKQGSYFQSAEQVAKSLTLLRRQADRPGATSAIAMLEACDVGMYVTF